MSLQSWISHLVYRHSERCDLRFDRRFGLDTCTPELDPDADQLPENLRADAQDYHATPIALFRRFVRRSRINPRDFGFVDLGAGKGRTLLLACDVGFDPVVGVEIDRRLCAIAAENIRKWGKGSPVVPIIVQGDARTAAMPAGNLFVFLFNPFTGRLFEEIAVKLAEVAREEGRAVVIAYHNDLCSDALEWTGAFKRVRMRRIHFWRPPTASFFYNDAAWRMRQGTLRTLLPLRRSARWRTVSGPATRQPGAIDSKG